MQMLVCLMDVIYQKKFCRNRLSDDRWGFCVCEWGVEFSPFHYIEWDIAWLELPACQLSAFVRCTINEQKPHEYVDVGLTNGVAKWRNLIIFNRAVIITKDNMCKLTDTALQQAEMSSLPDAVNFHFIQQILLASALISGQFPKMSISK